MLDTIIFTAANCLISTGLTIQLNFEAIYNIYASKVVIEQTQTIVVHSCICSLSLFNLFLGLPVGYALCIVMLHWDMKVNDDKLIKL